MSTTRQVVRVFSSENPATTTAEVSLPPVFLAPIRQDIVHFVFYNLNKNRRQAYGVRQRAGMEYNAESWGTGRAVARIPRVGGSGTHRSGQGAFGNMCRGGRMFNPNPVWRRWHRKVNLVQRRHAVASALAASAVPALVMARGHRVNTVPEIPLVVDRLNKQRTKDLVNLLTRLGVNEELDKCRNSRKIRTGQGKTRNRRYVMRRGPLVVYDSDNQALVQGARNIPGVDCCHVDRLNLLQLAPGGHLGRFIIWTQRAFERLNDLFGGIEQPSQLKKGYLLERPLLNNANLARIINSDEIQAVVRPKRRNVVLHDRRKRNPLTNRALMSRLNPFDAERVAQAKKTETDNKTNRQQRLKERAASRKKLRKFGRQYISNYRRNLEQANRNTETDYKNYIKSIKIGKDAMKFVEDS
jgi:large subunit ribosomal protein L4e